MISELVDFARELLGFEECEIFEFHSEKYKFENSNLYKITQNEEHLSNTDIARIISAHERIVRKWIPKDGEPILYVDIYRGDIFSQKYTHELLKRHVELKLIFPNTKEGQSQAFDRLREIINFLEV